MVELPCRYAMSYDGRVGGEDNTYDVPTALYIRHEYINAQNSDFRRIVSNDNKQVHEPLYMNYKK